MPEKICLYICSGCRISDCINTEALSDMFREIPEIQHVSVHEKLCSNDGVKMIHDSIAEKTPVSILIAACSQRYKSRAFDFGKQVQTERVNIREWVAYTQEKQSEDALMMAADYIRMGLAKLLNTILPQPYFPEEKSKEVLVLGGGITGMTAAKYIAGAGYKVKLIEKEKNLGGFTARLFKKTPSRWPYDSPEETGLEKTIEKVSNSDNIDILLNTELVKISGEPGNFLVESKNSETSVFRAGAIVLASGWQPYDASRLVEFHYSELDDVISNIEFEDMFKNSRVCRPSDKKLPHTVLFIQCAGSRDPDHLPYCSNYCCISTLKQAWYIRKTHPDSLVYIVYKDIRASGFYEYFYQEVQKDERIFFVKADVEDIQRSGDQLEVHISGSLLGEDIALQTDLVVLATGMTPVNSEILNLNYRLGKGLPELQYAFPDSHFICFPYETRRSGIYTAGTARAPMDIRSCMEDAAGAALKAIQCMEATARGEALHPRSGDLSYPQLYMQRCTDCKRCTEECPFGSYDENEKGTPLPNPARCRRCGICLGACPERVISFADFNIQAVASMIKAVHIPDVFQEKPRILVFVCENDALPAFDMAGEKHLSYSPFIRIIPVRCIGSVNKIWISDALSHGFDAVMQIGCKPGDDYQCHFIQGSELAETRSENIQEVLEKMMLEAERIKTVFIEINEYDKIPDIINNYVEEIELIGPNPFKDM